MCVDNRIGDKLSNTTSFPQPASRPCPIRGYYEHHFALRRQFSISTIHRRRAITIIIILEAKSLQCDNLNIFKLIHGSYVLI